MERTPDTIVSYGRLAQALTFERLREGSMLSLGAVTLREAEDYLMAGIEAAEDYANAH